MITASPGRIPVSSSSFWVSTAICSLCFCRNLFSVNDCHFYPPAIFLFTSAKTGSFVLLDRFSIFVFRLRSRLCPFVPHDPGYRAALHLRADPFLQAISFSSGSPPSASGAGLFRLFRLLLPIEISLSDQLRFFGIHIQLQIPGSLLVFFFCSTTSRIIKAVIAERIAKTWDTRKFPIIRLSVRSPRRQNAPRHTIWYIPKSFVRQTYGVLSSTPAGKAQQAPDRFIKEGGMHPDGIDSAQSVNLGRGQGRQIPLHLCRANPTGIFCWSFATAPWWRSQKPRH